MPMTQMRRMRVFHELAESHRAISSSGSHSSVAIGNFDGIHLGHQALLKTMVANAQAEGLVPAVLTFYPHPVEVLNPSKKLERLCTTSEKLALLESVGVEFVLVAKFDPALAGLSAEDFFEEYLVQGLQARAISVGFNFCFGRGRKGDTALLKTLADTAGIKLLVQEPVVVGRRVSSSYIREKISESQVREAAVLLGRPYSISGQVKPGDQRGRKLGFPTANLHCAAEKVLPKNGVYVTRVKWQRQEFKAVTNVGIRPTFNEPDAPKVVEVHLLDFSSRLYDEFLELEFLDHLRDEMKFASIDDLKAQIARDVEATRNSRAFDK